jgi:hypothetical protein
MFLIHSRYPVTSSVLSSVCLYGHFKVHCDTPAAGHSVGLWLSAPRGPGSWPISSAFKDWLSLVPFSDENLPDIRQRAVQVLNPCFCLCSLARCHTQAAFSQAAEPQAELFSPPSLPPSLTRIFAAGFWAPVWTLVSAQ